MFDIQQILRAELPDDTELGLARRFILSVIEPRVQAAYKRRIRMTIRFVTGPDEVELPDGMTMGEFRSYAATGEAKLAVTIDDGEGGARVNSPELV